MTDRDPEINVTHALEKVTVPAFVIDRRGRIRWLNHGAIKLFGNRVGQAYTRTVAPEDVHTVRAQFARKLIGEAAVTDYGLTVLDRHGRRLPVCVSSVPLCEGAEIVGVFGLACPAGAVDEGGNAREEAPSASELTARQYETLALLAEGLGTAAIASSLGVAEETARNHIRGLLRQLGVHSRLEAVVLAHRHGLLQRRRDV